MRNTEVLGSKQTPKSSACVPTEPQLSHMDPVYAQWAPRKLLLDQITHQDGLGRVISRGPALRGQPSTQQGTSAPLSPVCGGNGEWGPHLGLLGSSTQRSLLDGPDLFPPCLVLGSCFWSWPLISPASDFIAVLPCEDTQRRTCAQFVKENRHDQLKAFLGCLLAS